MIVRSRGFMSGSPPPARAATVSSLMMRVKILPRLASSGALLVLDRCPLGMAGHVRNSSEIWRKILPLFRRRMIQTSARASQGRRGSRRARVDGETGPLEPARSSAAPTACGTSARSGAPWTAPPRRSTIALLEDRQPPRAILADRLDEREMRAAARPRPRSCTRFEYSRQLGTSGTRSTPKRAAGLRARVPPTASVGVEIAVARAATAGCRTARGPCRSARRERQRADVAAHEARVGESAESMRFARSASARRARDRASARTDRCRRACTPARASGSEMRPVPHPSSSTGPSASSGDAPPERHVAAAERPRVLPVVERRVLVPAFPAFGRSAFGVSRSLSGSASRR